MPTAYPLDLGGRNIDLSDLSEYLNQLGFSYYYGISTYTNGRVAIISGATADSDDYNLMMDEVQVYFATFDEIQEAQEPE